MTSRKTRNGRVSMEPRIELLTDRIARNEKMVTVGNFPDTIDQFELEEMIEYDRAELVELVQFEREMEAEA